MSTADNKRIAKNTGFLYLRMLLTMCIAFFTTRIVLQQLGVQDFGIYNVVGGIVAMFSIISASLSSSISRFLTFELGKKNDAKLRDIFSTSMFILLGMSLVIILLVEIIGVWFLNNKMNISPDRMTAANWVLQCSVITFAINLISVPYNAAIIAHERMQAFAYIGLLEVVLKLVVALLLFISIFDSLIEYSILLLITSVLVRMAYSVYCNRHFTECKVKLSFNPDLLKTILSYSGWTFIGSSSSILKDQGVNIIMNIFCGTAVNAARGIAYQVNGAITSFSNNYMLAVNPQIIKLYAQEESYEMLDLSFRSSRFGFLMLYCLSLPAIIVMPDILAIWLTTVPPYTVVFTRLILVAGMLDAVNIPLQYINQATGKIKVYQLVVGGIQMLNFPISYVLLRYGFNPASVFIVSIIITQLGLAARLLILKRKVNLPIKGFFYSVYLVILKAALAGMLIPAILLYFRIFDFKGGVIILAILSVGSAFASTYYIGCNQSERLFLRNKLRTLSYKIIAKCRN